MNKLLKSFQPIKCAASDTRFNESFEGIKVDYGIGKEGDLVLVEVLSNSGAYSEIENLDGRSMKLYIGQKFIAVLGNRESSKNLVGGIPAEGINITDNTILHLLTNGGIVGYCKSSPYYMGEPLSLKCVGLLKREDKVLNTADNVGDWCEELGETTPILLIAGTATDAGKTTLTSNIISILSNKYNLELAGTKLAGTGCLEDVLQHKDAGAKWVMDFPDVGLPSTYTSPERYKKGIRTLLNRLNKKEPDLIVAELGGDIIWANIPTLLTMPDVMKNVIGIVLVPLDILGVIGSFSLFEKWEVTTPVHLVNSPFRNTYASQIRNEKYVGVKSYDPTNEEDVNNLVEQILSNSLVRQV
ncbi:hypothetical protein QRD88_03080 [Bacillus safensis]|uniref:hypothetical protein n=1 Tax=Bacillus safensis TaxID=561879 RepID=UPI001BAD37EE|nr:hypothetical protein [Bacillus safensis]MBR0607492.1 hypothetical protein [Bacillus safensis]WJE39812.1 hypothetical protein QRD88_03080 [Bacillus safensis]